MSQQTANVKVKLNGQEAEDQLDALQGQAKKLKGELERAFKAGDVKGYNKLKKELSGIQKETRGIKKQMFDVDKVIRNLSGASLQDIKKVQTQLNRELSSGAVKRNSKEWKMLNRKLQLVGAEMKKVRAEMMGAQSMSTRLANGFNKYFSMVTAAAASLLGLIMVFRQAVDAANEFDSSLSNLSALTGLVGEDLEYLKERATEFSGSMLENGIRITKSSQDMLDAYTQMGSKRPELLKDKEALASVTEQAVILSQAAKMELVPATNSLAVSMNQFNAKAKDAPRYINAIAAGSKEGAGDVLYIAEALEKSGTAADMAGLSIEQTIGVIETIAPKFSKPSRAGTQLKNIFVKLQTGVDEFNPSVVGLEQALNNLGDANLSTTEMVKLFKVENLNAAQTLIDNRKEYVRYRDAVTDTNVAIEQAIKNTANNKAKLEAARQTLAKYVIELGTTLAPMLTFSTSSFSYLVKATLKAIKFFNKYKTVIVGTTAAVIAYSLAVNAAAIKAKIYSAATAIATRATAIFNTTLKANPIALVIGLLAGAAAAFYSYSKKADDSTESQKDFNDELERTSELAGQSIYNKMREEGQQYSEWAKNTTKSELLAVQEYLEETIASMTRDLANMPAESIAAGEGIFQEIIDAKIEELDLLKAEIQKRKPKPADNNATLEEFIAANKEEFEEWKLAAEIYRQDQEQWQKEYDQRMQETENEEFFLPEEPEADDGIDTDYVLVRAQTELEAYQDSYQGRLDALKQMLDKGEILQKDYEERVWAVNQEFVNKKLEKYYSYLDHAAMAGQAVSDLNIAMMNNELAKAGDNEVEQERIRIKYAKRDQLISSGQALIKGGMAIMNLWGNNILPYPAAAVFNGIMTGVIAATTQTQIAAINAPQFKDGRIPVTGQDDGKMYFADYIGKPNTGIVKGPSLISEQGDEMIVDGATTKSLQINYPEIIQGIKEMSFGLVPQFANGSYPIAVDDKPKQTMTDPALLAVMMEISQVLKTPNKSLLVTDEQYLRLQDEKQKEWSQFKAKVSA